MHLRLCEGHRILTNISLKFQLKHTPSRVQCDFFSVTILIHRQFWLHTRFFRYIWLRNSNTTESNALNVKIQVSVCHRTSMSLWSMLPEVTFSLRHHRILTVQHIYGSGYAPHAYSTRISKAKKSEPITISLCSLLVSFDTLTAKKTYDDLNVSFNFKRFLSEIRLIQNLHFNHCLCMEYWTFQRIDWLDPDTFRYFSDFDQRDEAKR